MYKRSLYNLLNVRTYMSLGNRTLVVKNLSMYERSLNYLLNVRTYPTPGNRALVVETDIEYV